MAERDVQAEVMLEFGALPYLRIWRQNTGVAVYESKTGAKTFVKYGVPGGADLSGLLACGKRVELECKREGGGRHEPEQKRFGAMIARMGGMYALVSSVADARAALDSHLTVCDTCRSRRQFAI